MKSNTNNQISKHLCGKVYWTEKSCRVRLESGRLVDMGKRAKEAAQLAARTAGLEFVEGHLTQW